MAAIAHIASTTPAGAASGATTSATNMTGADCILGGVVSYNGYDAPSFTDSSANSYTRRVLNETNACRVEIYECIAPTVTSSMTFTCAQANSYSSVSASGYSGVKSTGAFDQSSHATSSSATSLAPGSVTPSEGGELLFAVGGFAATGTGSTYTVASPFTTRSALNYSVGTYVGIVTGDEIQTTATARNPSCGTMSSSAAIVAGIVTMKSQDGPPGGTSIPVFMHHYMQQLAA